MTGDVHSCGRLFLFNASRASRNSIVFAAVDRNAAHGNHQVLDQAKVLDRPAIFVNGPAGAHPTLTLSPFEQVVRIRRPCIHRKTFCDPIPDLPRGALVHVWPSEWRYVGYDGFGAADEIDVRAINPLGLLPR